MTETEGSRDWENLDNLDFEWDQPLWDVDGQPVNDSAARIETFEEERYDQKQAIARLEAELREARGSLRQTLEALCDLLGCPVGEDASDLALSARAALVISDLQQDNKRLQEWVNDLQADKYINCVYCGHRYGPDTEVPAAMADVLKEHIESCPKHPMSALKAERTALRALVAWWLSGGTPESDAMGLSRADEVAVWLDRLDDMRESDDRDMQRDIRVWIDQARAALKEQA